MSKPDDDATVPGFQIGEREVVGDEILEEEQTINETQKGMGNVSKDLGKLISDLGQMKKGNLPF